MATRFHRDKTNPEAAGDIDVDSVTAEEIVDLVLGNGMPEYLHDTNDNDEEVEIMSRGLVEDLTPGSAPIQKYLTAGEKTTKIWKTKPYYKLEWQRAYRRVWGRKIGYWKLVRKKYYRRYLYDTETNPIPLLAASTPVALIYGTNSHMRDIISDKEKFDEIKKYSDKVGDLMNTAGVVNAARAGLNGAISAAAFCSFNIPLGIAAGALATKDGILANYSFKGSKILLDIDGTVNNRIYNTKISDGFVPKEAVLMPQKELGGCTWGSNRYYATHLELADSEEIWGEKGSITKGLTGGYIAGCMEDADLIEASYASHQRNFSCLPDDPAPW